MTKAEFIDAVAAKTGETKALAEQNINAVFAALTDLFTKGDKLTVPGFGTFSTTIRAAKTCTNPQNGQKINVPAKKAPKFKPSDKLIIEA